MTGIDGARYRVVLQEASTGIVLRSPGVYARDVDAAAVAHHVASLAEARAFARQVVEAHDEVECVIHEGDAPLELVRAAARPLWPEVVRSQRPPTRWARWRAWFARWFQPAR